MRVGQEELIVLASYTFPRFLLFARKSQVRGVDFAFFRFWIFAHTVTQYAKRYRYENDQYFIHFQQIKSKFIIILMKLGEHNNEVN